jgi:DNA repair exonuclease SbcCD ATPase subunit
MRIRSVTAHAFGPLAGEKREFADGMTVIVGDNESGKSSWHAAIFAALCGRRRGAGRPREDEQRFIDSHKPWDGDRWLVSAEIRLDDGRRIEMRQDLAGKVDCHAKDLDISEDVSAEVMNEGAPDASRWLGLDRSSFVGTACIEQAQMLRVRTEARGLQQHLQRAAATANANSTAAAALAQITSFRSQHVGRDQANSTRPLRRALNAVGSASNRLETARSNHEHYLRLAQQTDDLWEAAQNANAAVAAHEAAAAANEAAQLAGQAKRANDLHEMLGDAPPASIAEDDALARQVTAALTAWRMQPDKPATASVTSTEIRERLNAPIPVADEGGNRSRSVGVAFIAAGAAALAGIALLASVSRVGGIVLLAAAAILVALGISQHRRRHGTEPAQQNAQRQVLQARLEAAEQAEQRAEEDLQKRAGAAQLVIEALDACGLTAPTPEAAAAALEQWLASHRTHVGQLGTAQREWAELQALLDGRTLQQLNQDASSAADHARDVAVKAGPALLPSINPATAAGKLTELREIARQAERKAANSSGELQQFARSVTSVAEAEEALQADEDELDRVRELEETLTLTSQLLERAQDRVHRSIAPALAATIQEWLPTVTAGRYTDVTVNPITLQVEVCDPTRPWRKADLLSYGTAEQIYLLLRIALADHLTKNHDTCPLILDDVTVHADHARTRDILDLLLKIAAHRQVILFSQEEQVAAWAHENLDSPDHAIHALQPLAFS